MKSIYQMIIFDLLFLLVGGASASADHAVTTWTAYLYQGPGSHYSVVDEVPQGTPVELSGCSGAWCKVTLQHRIGYLPAEVVAKGDPSKPAPGLLQQPAAAVDPHRATGSCVKANQTGGNGGNAMTLFCLK